MILVADTIRDLGILTPCVERAVFESDPLCCGHGCSYGLSQHAYDIRVKQAMTLPAGVFKLASTVERFVMPHDVCGVVHEKSSLIRQGLAVHNTVLDAGWEGWLTLELKNVGADTLYIDAGQPIAQVLFHRLERPVAPYRGKYDQQPDEPVEARRET